MRKLVYLCRRWNVTTTLLLLCKTFLLLYRAARYLRKTK